MPTAEERLDKLELVVQENILVTQTLLRMFMGTLIPVLGGNEADQSEATSLIEEWAANPTPETRKALGTGCGEIMERLRADD